MRQKEVFIVSIVVLLYLPVLGTGLSIDSHYFDPAQVELRNKNQALGCWWDVSDALNITVYWYNGTNHFRNMTYALQDNNYDYISKNSFFRSENWDCIINVSNATDTITSTISTSIQNAEPLFQTANDHSFTEDKEKTVVINATDADGDAINYSYVANVVFDSFNLTSGEITWTPGNASIGTHEILYKATDALGKESQFENVSYTVLARNDPPYFTTEESYPPVPVFQNETLNYKFIARDEENDQGPFNFSLNSSYVSQVGIERVNITTSDNKNGYMQFIYNETYKREPGNYSVTLTICEEATGGCMNTTFNLSVISVNIAPLITDYTTGSWTQGDAFAFYVNATDYNTDDLLSFDVFSNNCTSPDPWSIQALYPPGNNNTGLMNFTALNNSHVDCNNITITVIDSMNAVTRLDLVLDIQNLNDPPVIHQNSTWEKNSHPWMNKNLTNLTALTGLPFIYKVNATDPDLLISSANENLAFWTNATACSDCPIFTIDNNGVINVTFTDNILGTFPYRINVTDTAGVMVTTILTLSLQNNSAPVFDQALTDQNVSEDGLFYYEINATDLENNMIAFSDNIAFFSIDQQGVFNVTTNCSMVGEHNVTITVNDSFGAATSAPFLLNITFSPDPVLFTHFSGVAVEGQLYQADAANYVVDEDLDPACTNQVDAHQYTFSAPGSLSNFNVISESLIYFSPGTNSHGNYTINVTINDSYGYSATGNISLEVLDRGFPPVITNITPGDANNITKWFDPSLFAGNTTSLTLQETIGSVVFNQTSMDPDGDELLFSWYLNDTPVSNNQTIFRSQYYTTTFGFNSSGIYNYTVVVSDNVSGYIVNNVSFSWNLTVIDVNRPPNLTQNFSTIKFGGRSILFPNYFTSGDAHYEDPDGDNMSFGYNENLSLLNDITITANGSDLTVGASAVGLSYVFFYADDGKNTTLSNNVTINVTFIPSAQDQIVQSTSSGGGGGGSSTTTIVQTITEEVEKEVPIYLDILVPSPVTIYQNNTVRAPITITNNANQTLTGISLSAETNVSNVSMSFSVDQFEGLAPGSSASSELFITSYRIKSSYEVVLYANITDPAYTDKAVIYVNSIEKSRGNDSVTNTKITFARDLLSSNPECMELTEFLKKAQTALGRRQIQEANTILDSVIQGCKYLVSQSKIKTERPEQVSFLQIPSIPYLRYVFYAIGTFFGLLIMLSLVSRLKKHR